MGESAYIGDSVLVTFSYGWDVGLSNNSAQAVVADALQQNGLALTRYDNSQVGFTGGPVSLTVRLQATGYGDKQDVATAIAGILQNQLGLAVTNPTAVAVYRGSSSQPFEVDAGPGSYMPMRTPSTGVTIQQNIPTIDANPWVVGVVNIPIPPEPGSPVGSNSLDWIDKLAAQFHMSRSTLEFAGFALVGVLVLVVMTRE